jgi:hypothetical protein
MNFTRTLALGALMALVPAFAQSVTAQDRPEPPNPEGVLVVVHNHGFYDQHVYAVQGGQRRTIGLVTGLSSQTVELPRTMVESQDDIQVLALPIAGGTPYVSQMLLVSPGDQITVTLHTDATFAFTTVGAQEVEEEPEPDDTPDASPIRSD